MAGARPALAPSPTGDAQSKIVADQDRLGRGRVDLRRDLVFVQVCGLHVAIAHTYVFHQRVAQALQLAAFDLTRKQQGVDHPPDLLDGDDAPWCDRACFAIDGHFSRLSHEHGRSIALAGFEQDAFGERLGQQRRGLGETEDAAVGCLEATWHTFESRAVEAELGG